MGFQFMASTPMACLTLFRISTMEMGSKMYECVMYIVCTLVQLSYYCWYGNEVKLKSLEIPDVIFSSNWPDLDNSSKKMLMIIMKRATSPIEFSSGHIVALNLNTFMSVSFLLSNCAFDFYLTFLRILHLPSSSRFFPQVLKTSYSVFNVLHTA
ncbi:odorant receptor 10-like [Lasioglossum baleicum]|uniref:odorant receptor 10-like n=1 Tax=Lasioglossum baleicum TaxID=434251 RepID=UPI003FCD701D